MHRSLWRWAAVALLAAGAWAGLRWWSSDARRIGAALDALEEAAEKSGPESDLVRLAKARELLARFAPGFVVFARPYAGTITDRQQLAAVVERYRSTASRVAVSDRDRQLEVRDNGTAELVCVLRVDGLRDVGPGRETFRVRIGWRREGGDWLIQEVEILEVLETSGLFG